MIKEVNFLFHYRIVVKLYNTPIENMETWCNENIGPFLYSWTRNYIRKENLDECSFLFRTGSDAVFFKLRFSDFIISD